MEVFKFKNPLLIFAGIAFGLGLLAGLIGFIIHEEILYFYLALLAIWAVIFIFIWLGMKLAFNSKLKKYDGKYGLSNLEMEINKPTTISYSGIYITDNYLISNIKGNLFVCTYNEIVWVFSYHYYVNSVPMNLLVGYIKGSKKKQTFLANTSPANIDKTISMIMSKNPSALIGNTKENKEKYKTM